MAPSNHALEIAFGELWPRAVAEVPGDGDNPRIVEYHAATSLRSDQDEVAWCSAFMCWVHEKAGFRSPRSARARDWLRWGFRAAYPHPGTVVVLNRGGPHDPNVIEAPGHVGIVAGVGCMPDSIVVISGNVGNRVTCQSFLLREVLGFRVPTVGQGGLPSE